MSGGILFIIDVQVKAMDVKFVDTMFILLHNQLRFVGPKGFSRWRLGWVRKRREERGGIFGGRKKAAG